MIAEPTGPLTFDEFVAQVATSNGAYPCFVEEKIGEEIEIYPVLFDGGSSYRSSERDTVFYDLGADRDIPGIEYGVTWRAWGMRVPTMNECSKVDW